MVKLVLKEFAVKGSFHLNWLDKLDRKFGRHYIHNLMGILIAGSAAVYIIEYVFRIGLYNYIYLDPQLVMQGEVWRLVTFVFVLLPGNIYFAAFAFYFYYIAGKALENEWGGFKFNIYYLVGVLATIVVSLLTKYPITDNPVNLSLFLAYAKLYGENELNLFFLLPIKVKYLGTFNWILIILNIINALMARSIGALLLALVPIINYLLFFSRSNYRYTKMRTGSVIRMKDYKKKVNSVKKEYTHKCTVCGITDIENPDMEFRYCSKCNGKHAYCSKHIMDHTHID